MTDDPTPTDSTHATDEAMLAPIPPSTPPRDVLTALGFDPAAVRAVVITDHSVVAVAASVPDVEHPPDPTPEPEAKPEPDPEPSPEPSPDATTEPAEPSPIEEDPDAHA